MASSDWPQPIDRNHVRWVNEALNGSMTEFPVKMTIGEMFLFHTLLQDYGLPFTGEDRFIPLMERSKARIDSIDTSEDPDAA